MAAAGLRAYADFPAYPKAPSQPPSKHVSTKKKC
jgi:hypothetical protein